MVALPLLIAAIGLLSGGLSGLLGIGGGILTAPLLLYLPEILGMPGLGMHAVSGLTITQALFSGLFGAVGLRGAGTIDRRLALVMGGVGAATSLVGAAWSKLLPDPILRGVFLALALAAAALLVAPVHHDEGEGYVPGSFPAVRAAAIAGGVGLLGGMVGQGGSFILIPLVLVLLRVPTRVAMATNLPVVAASSLAGFVGKAATGQVPLGLTLALLAGVAPGALLGARLGRRASGRTLRWLLAALICGVCARMVLDLVR